jgi:putative colanic acid biosynthesis acetyltransferase WcaF
MHTNPGGFVNPHGLRNKAGRALWGLAYLLAFRFTPRWLGAWRNFLLRCFGARIRSARFHPSVRVWAPWLLEVGEQVTVAEGVHLYNAYGITLGDRVILSQGAFLCTASHDYNEPTYPLTGGRIVVADDCWVAAEAFLAPGVRVGEGAVVGARACVFKDVAPWTVVGGNPACVLKERRLRGGPNLAAPPHEKPAAP